MVKSLFLDYIKHFQGIVLATVRKYNGKAGEEPFLYQKYLDKKFSADGRWSSITGMFKNLIADYVALNSPAPLKSRGSKGMAEGVIPKVSNKYQMDEQAQENVDNMILRAQDEKLIVQELFEDAKEAVANIYRLNEYSFIKGLCDGILEADKDVSNGIAIRADFGYKNENLFNVTTSNAITRDDIEQVINKAQEDGNVIDTLFLDKVSLGRLKESQSIREAFAFNNGYMGENVPTLTEAKVREYFQAEWNIKLETGVDKVFKIEKDGVEQSVRPWTNGMMVFSSSDKVGTLVYSQTVEHNRRAKQADYAEADYILVSKYSELDPIAEFTKAEAKVLPVITNVNGIYKLNTNVAKG